MEMHPWIHLDVAMSGLSPVAQNDKMSIEEQLSCLAKDKERRAAHRDRLIRDEAIRMHTAARDLRRLDRHHEDHTCNKACGMKPLCVALYEKRGIAHVCTTSVNMPCPMTTEFHINHLNGFTKTHLTTDIYVCPTSGSFHVCNDACDQCYVSDEGQRVCPLTALVLGLDPNSDSVDWVHDAVDRGDFASVPVPSGGCRGGVKRKRKEAGTHETDAVHFASNHTDEIQRALVTLYTNAKQIRDTRATGENMVSEIQTALHVVHAAVHKVVT